VGGERASLGGLLFVLDSCDGEDVITRTWPIIRRT
jgi:hypothetical protein